MKLENWIKCLIVSIVLVAFARGSDERLRELPELTSSDLLDIWVTSRTQADLLQKKQSLVDCRPLFKAYRALPPVPLEEQIVVVSEGENLVVKLTEILDKLGALDPTTGIVSGDLRIRLVAPQTVRTASMIYLARSAKGERIVRGRLIQILPHGEPVFFPNDAGTLDPAASKLR